MTIPLKLPPELEAQFVAEATATGVSVGDVVKAYLFRAAPVRGDRQFSATDIERALDEAADLVPEELPPLSDEAMSRESIYTREDDWNK